MNKTRICEINKEVLESINFYEPISLETSLEDAINDWGAE